MRVVNAAVQAALPRESRVLDQVGGPTTDQSEAAADMLVAEFDSVRPGRHGLYHSTLSNGWQVTVQCRTDGGIDRRAVFDANGFKMTRLDVLKVRLMDGAAAAAEQAARPWIRNLAHLAKCSSQQSSGSGNGGVKRLWASAVSPRAVSAGGAERPAKKARAAGGAAGAEGDDGLPRFRAISQYGREEMRLGDFPTAPIAALCVARNERTRQMPAVVAAEDAVGVVRVRMAAERARLAAQGALEGRTSGGSSSETGGSRVAEAILESNDDANAGSFAVRWLVKWADRTDATWEPRHKIPAPLLAAHEHKLQTNFNVGLEPLLLRAPPGCSDAPSGVVALSVSAADATLCADHLHTHWRNGRLMLPDGRTCLGYSSYGKTLSTHDAKQQSTHTLLITNILLPSVRLYVPGFLRMEQQLASWLHRTHGTVVELFYAHGLRQSPETVRSTGFSVHQDTEDFDFIEYTIVAKLTPDGEGEAPSAMRVVGADRHFYYGGRAGDAGAFRARLFHASVEPQSEREHLKVAFFFRNSVKGERLAKRALVGVDGANEEVLAQRRAEVQARMSRWACD